jgi:iron(III) transport system substrate-binding protein
LATAPFSDDTRLLQAIDAGQCDVGIANTYYYGRYIAQNPGASVAIAWPNQQSSGVHVNISGAGVTRHAKNPKQAQRLLEWLASAKGQNAFADDNLEYPANPSVKPAATVSAWGTFKANQLNVSQAGRLQRQATQLMDRAGYR